MLNILALILILVVQMTIGAQYRLYNIDRQDFLNNIAVFSKQLLTHFEVNPARTTMELGGQAAGSYVKPSYISHQFVQNHNKRMANEYDDSGMSYNSLNQPPTMPKFINNQPQYETKQPEHLDTMSGYYPPGPGNNDQNYNGNNRPNFNNNNNNKNNYQNLNNQQLYSGSNNNNNDIRISSRESNGNNREYSQNNNRQQYSGNYNNNNNNNRQDYGNNNNNNNNRDYGNQSKYSIKKPYNNNQNNNNRKQNFGNYNNNNNNNNNNNRNQYGRPNNNNNQYPAHVEAAVKSMRSVEVVNMQYAQPNMEPHVIDIGGHPIPIILKFNSVSSPVRLVQKHSPAVQKNEPVEESRSMEEPQMLYHEVLKPIIQEVREIITPYRKVTQEIRPVEEEIHTIIAKMNKKKKINQSSFTSTSTVSTTRRPTNQVAQEEVEEVEEEPKDIHQEVDTGSLFQQERDEEINDNNIYTYGRNAEDEGGSRRALERLPERIPERTDVGGVKTGNNYHKEEQQKIEPNSDTELSEQQSQYNLHYVPAIYNPILDTIFQM